MRNRPALTLFHRWTLYILLALGSCSHPRAPRSAEDVWEDAAASIVYVTAEGIDGKISQGSGFIAELEGKRWVVTNPMPRNVPAVTRGACVVVFCCMNYASDFVVRCFSRGVMSLGIPR